MTIAASLNIISHFMRAFIIYAVILTFHLNSVNGQTKIVLDGSSRIDTTSIPLVFVDTFKTDMNHLVLNPQKIESINIFKDSEAISKFGVVGKGGVIFIRPKAHTTFLRVEKIL